MKDIFRFSSFYETVTDISTSLILKYCDIIADGFPDTPEWLDWRKSDNIYIDII